MPTLNAMSIVEFHLKQARNGIREFALSLQASMQILILLAGQAMLMAIGFLAWPLWQITVDFQSDGALSTLLAWLLAYAILLSLPFMLLRKRILPQSTLDWTRSLPIPSAMRWNIRFALARLFLLPIVIGLLISNCACWWQWDAIHSLVWLGLTVQLGCLLCIFILQTLTLYWYEHHLTQKIRSAPIHIETTSKPQDYQFIRSISPFLHTWLKCYALPMWRLENSNGKLQMFLAFSACLFFANWGRFDSEFIRFVLQFSANSCLIFVSDQAIKSVQERTNDLSPVLRSLPLSARKLEYFARFACIAPALLILIGISIYFQQHSARIHLGVAAWFLGMHVLAQCLLALLHISAEVRARIVLLFIITLAAFGSELWK